MVVSSWALAMHADNSENIIHGVRGGAGSVLFVEITS